MMQIDTKKKMKIFVTGHKGLVGSAIVRTLIDDSRYHLITEDKDKLDLLDQAQVENYLTAHKPDLIINCAAKVGGILANDNNKLVFLRDNIRIQENLLHSASRIGVPKFFFLGSSCIYPKFCEQPIKETELLSGKLEKTNEAYALAKIIGLKTCQYINESMRLDYRVLMPCNLYGKNDTFSDKDGHVIPSMMVKFHRAKLDGLDRVVLWGTGQPRREFLHADDLAEAVKKLIEVKKQKFFEVCPEGILNIGASEDISIRELAELIKGITGYSGKVNWDPGFPDGTPQKLLSSSRIKSFGWNPKIQLEVGIREVYKKFSLK